MAPKAPGFGLAKDGLPNVGGLDEPNPPAFLKLGGTIGDAATAGVPNGLET